MENMDFEAQYQILTENCFFSNEALDLLLNINGMSIDTLNDAIMCDYACNDIYELLEENGINIIIA